MKMVLITGSCKTHGALLGDRVALQRLKEALIHAALLIAHSFQLKCLIQRERLKEISQDIFMTLKKLAPCASMAPLVHSISLRDGVME
jgi:putative protein kinase ArgK-like GTPase of G3E family